MKIEVDEFGDIVLKEVYSGINLETNSKENMYICMRDGGFEFIYENKKYSAQEGVIKEMEHYD